ncbi:MAG: hypothetical protein IPM79_01880 [Polyangiaceae bacterium]|nr:hypothetical protein [Polyangiaceae bacterium]MBK8936420.1 hypothetical protein [Polyangiaceae bacterium]
MSPTSRVRPVVGSPARRALRAAALAVACMAPSAGNIGSCGQDAVPLDAAKFLAAKNAVDCSSCIECGLQTAACDRACDGVVPADASFPAGCLPLVHDGEVCLDALSATGCSEYGQLVADEGSTIPTECDFCPVDETGSPDRDE